jgi:hypothetical protein
LAAQVDDRDLKQRFSPYVDQFIVILKNHPKPELFVEILGCLANLNLPKFNFGDLVQRHDLLNFLAEYAKPGMVEDDILLEVVMFVGAPLPSDRLLQWCVSPYSTVDLSDATGLQNCMNTKLHRTIFIFAEFTLCGL